MEPNPLLTEAAPPTAGPDLPQDPAELWAEAQRQSFDDQDDDPFGFGGGLDFLADDPPRTDHPSSASAAHEADPNTTVPHQQLPDISPHTSDSDTYDPLGLGGSMKPTPPPPAADALVSSSPHAPSGPASAASHGTMASTYHRPRQPAGTASASPHGTSPDQLPKPRCLPAAPLQVKAETSLNRQSHTIQRSDRRTALAAHLSSTTDGPHPRPSLGPQGASPSALAAREADLRTATAALQQRCAAITADLTAAHARQGPLLQRLHRASRAFAELLPSPTPPGAPAPLSSLHAVLSSLRGTPPGVPR